MGRSNRSVPRSNLENPNHSYGINIAVFVFQDSLLFSTISVLLVSPRIFTPLHFAHTSVPSMAINPPPVPLPYPTHPPTLTQLCPQITDFSKFIPAVRVSKKTGSSSSSGSDSGSSSSSASMDVDVKTAEHASRPTTLPSSALRTSKRHEKFEGDVDVISSERSQFTFGDKGKSACTFFCVEAASRFILDPKIEPSVELLDSILDECMSKWESSGAADRKVEHAAAMEVISFVPEYDRDVRLVEHLIHQAGIPRARKGAITAFAKWIANAVANWTTTTEEEHKEYQSSRSSRIDNESNIHLSDTLMKASILLIAPFRSA
eukprot:TRINITY_DN899_c0_g2_i1.p1 TRINITY_DN899_c0_g2~~TRINITY_DN899_c0_g2_i1.p1  ORF type:complete len:319 (-),score=59.87 TRINITY_DN899_c0_g2_i1:405-1361(-)